MARGYTLIHRVPCYWFAVSASWGCTGTKDTIAAVIIEARSMVDFIGYIKQKQEEERKTQCSITK